MKFLKRLYRKFVPRVDPHQGRRDYQVTPAAAADDEPAPWWPAPRSLPGLFGRVHSRDFMIAGDAPEQVAVYQRIGESAAALATAGLEAAGRTVEGVRALLDFGCGYGRVTRVFAQKMPPDKISVFDVDPAASRFCGEEFGARSLTFAKGGWNWDSVGFGKYDWIWVGSVFTHLDEAYTRETMELLISLLEPGGVLVFTTHGDEALRRTTSRDWFDPRIYKKREQIHHDYGTRGFHFTPLTAEELAVLPFKFERAAEFGYTWMTEAYTRALLDELSGGRMQVKSFLPGGWEGYQDAFFCQLD